MIAVPKEGEHFTEFYILGAEGKAADYPTSFALNTPQWVTVGVGNHQNRNVTYTVEAQAVNQTFDPATNTSTIDRMQLLNRYQVTLAQNTTDEQKLTFTVHKPGYNEIQFLLFNDGPRRFGDRAGAERPERPRPAPLDQDQIKAKQPPKRGDDRGFRSPIPHPFLYSLFSIKSWSTEP